MADYDRRPRGRGGYNNSKRRYRADDDDYDRQAQRRRYSEPLSSRVRKGLLSIAESPYKAVEEEVHSVAKLVSDNYDDEETRQTYFDLTIQIVLEQPFKIPFVAAVLVVLNGMNRGEEAVATLLEKATKDLNVRIKKGEWREVKLLLKYLGSLQGLLIGDGVWPILNQLFERAGDLQTASSDDTLGIELTKVILFTIPYIMASSASESQEHATALLDKTEIIAGNPSPLETLVDPYPGNGIDEVTEPTSVIALLQQQLMSESTTGWELKCIPRPWKMHHGANDEVDPLAATIKHALPQVTVPSTVIAGERPLFPEIYFSVYANQDIETVPPTTDIASTILRDSIVDTLNNLDFNRNATARYLIDIDCYFTSNIFVKRATPFDRLREIDNGRSTWKPEDVAVDAVFSQLFQLPAPQHKLVYYHSVLTEACKIAPAAIAPSLGRAIRYLYRNVDKMDLELSYRFVDWFAHHLSNFGFTWKWTEWIDDVELSPLHPKKAFIAGALDKEVRLSFAQRIKGTLPEPYQPLITEGKEKDTPDFKYNEDDTPFASEGREILALLKRKAPEDEIQPIIDQIHSQATTMALPEPLLSSTDAYVTAICYIGSKSLSHVLSCIERCKTRLLEIGAESETARRQIITSVMDYWKDQPGIAVNIVDKLLNYTILTPLSVIQWAIVEDNSAGDKLAESYIFEMVYGTVHKVTSRVRNLVTQGSGKDMDQDKRMELEELLVMEKKAMEEMFAVLEEALVSWANGSKDEAMEAGLGETSDEKQIRTWAERWLRVFRRKMAVEQAYLIEATKLKLEEETADAKMEEDVAEV